MFKDATRLCNPLHPLYSRVTGVCFDQGQVKDHELISIYNVHSKVRDARCQTSSAGCEPDHVVPSLVAVLIKNNVNQSQ